MSIEEEVNNTEPNTTYEWLCTNPLATSCGGAICSFYSVSKNYNRMTNWTFGSVESVLGYASEKAKPYVGAVAGKLEKPMETVDGYVAGELKKLEVKYPIIGRPPSEIATEGKNAVTTALQSSQETLGNTRVGALFGYGVDVTLDMTEGLVDKVLPPATTEETEEDNQAIPVEEEKQPAVKKSSWFGLRKRKTKKVEEEPTEVENPVIPEPVLSRSDRIQNLSYAVYYRTLTKVQSLQQEVHVYLQRLRTTLNLLQYAQSVSANVDKQRQNVAQALRDADAKIREYFSKKSQSKSNEEFVAWLSDGESHEDISWLLQSNDKKDVFHAALDYAKSVSGKSLEMLRSISNVTGYFPVWLRDGINNSIQQVQDVYSTLVLNNVPAELPSFLLTQVVEIVETQLVFCKKLGNHVSSALKSRFGYKSIDGDDQSETSSEVRLDLVEEEEKETEKEKEKDKEKDSSSSSSDSDSSDESND